MNGTPKKNSSGAKKVKVLLIEDNPGDARLVKEMLNEAGHGSFNLACVEQLESGLEHLAKEKTDVILLDLNLPDSQGLNSFIKIYNRRKNIPIIILTGTDDEELAINAVRKGAQDYLVKSKVDGNLLVRAFLYAIERQRLQLELENFRQKEQQEREEKLKEYSEQLEEMVEKRTKELKEAQEELIRQEKLTVIGQLAGGVGHELRNPLGTIKNAAYFLNMVLEKPEPQVKETLEFLMKEVSTSERIISSLLDYARPKPPSRHKVNVNAVVQDVLSRNAIPKTIEMTNKLDEGLPTILADPDQLTLVFGNITLNAIQAMPEGGSLVVKSSACSKEWISVSFKDSGKGIPKEDLGKIFKPLFTTKAKGVGLGLAVTKILVEGHGGTIEVESELGKGSTFTIKLPTHLKL